MFCRSKTVENKDIKIVLTIALNITVTHIPHIRDIAYFWYHSVVFFFLQPIHSRKLLFFLKANSLYRNLHSRAKFYFVLFLLKIEMFQLRMKIEAKQRSNTTQITCRMCLVFPDAYGTVWQ